LPAITALGLQTEVEALATGKPVRRFEARQLVAPTAGCRKGGVD
jgi:hypothetical protein